MYSLFITREGRARGRMPSMSREDGERIASGAELVGVRLEVAQVERLERFGRLLAERAVPLGMVGRGDAGRLVERHIMDCLRAIPPLREAEARSVADLGSGAGLPGVVIAIALPGVGVVLAEARSKRAAFLEMAAVELGLANVAVHASRVEALPGPFDACTAWALARPLLRPGGHLLLFAGRSWTAERPARGFEGGEERVIELSVSRVPPASGDRPRPGSGNRPSTSAGWLESAGPLVMITRT